MATTTTSAPTATDDAVVRRVRIAQASARDGLALAGAFVVAALVAAVEPGVTGRWLPLHLFLAGSLVCAISGASILLAVTWSAAPAPARRWTRLQLALVAVGVAGVAAARSTSCGGALLLVPAASFAAGLVLLAGLLASSARRGSQRRFDVATGWYVAAVACGVVAVGFGAALATGHADAGAREIHVALNVLGLVGLVVGGTVPNLAATVARARMSPRATASGRAALLAWQLVALVAVVAGAAELGLAAYGAGIVALLAMVPAPTSRQVSWAGPRLVGFHAGLVWWLAAVVAASWHGSLAGRPLLVLAVAGYGQLVWASAAYLVPVVRAGGHERLAAGFARTRSWVGVVGINAAGVLLATGATSVAVVVVAAVALDAVRRGAVVLRGAA